MMRSFSRDLIEQAIVHLTKRFNEYQITLMRFWCDIKVDYWNEDEIFDILAKKTTPQLYVILAHVAIINENGRFGYNEW